MVRDLRADPPPADWASAGFDGVELRPLRGRPDAELAPALAAAYAPGRVDHVPGEVPLEYLDALLSGRAAGPLRPCSVVAVAGDAAVGAIVMTDDRPHPPSWEGGAFVGDLFRDPDPRWRGLGEVLLKRALAAAAAAGAPRVGLSATEGNPTVALYERLGFTILATREVVPTPLR